MTRGEHNNNPPNIRHSAYRWEGARVEQTDKSFVQCENLAYGDRAAWKILESYWKHFHRTRQSYNVKNIIARWAPPTENNTQAYIQTVLRLTRLGGNEHLPQPSRGVDIERMVKLVTAMTTVECGIPYAQVDTESIRQGYELAFPGKRSYARTQPPADYALAEDMLIWDEYRDW